MSAFDKHRDELEKHETMMGQSRGRLAVALDLLTDALAMVGQHGVYCQSARTPGRPTMDIALVLEQIGDAKELVQSVIESERSMSAIARADRCRRALQPARAARAVRSWRPVSRARHQGRDARSRCGCCPPISPPTAPR